MSLERIDAEEFSQSLEQIGEGWFRQLALGIKLGAPEALGLSRREWSDRIGLKVRDRAERITIEIELAGEGLSNRAIADVLGIDEGTVRNDRRAENSADGETSSEEVERENAANSAPDEEPEGGDCEGYAAFAADIPEILKDGDIPERVKDAIVLLDSSIRFYHPYRFGGQKVGEYAKRKLTDDLAELICLYWSEGVWWRGKAPAEWDLLERQWRSLGILVDDREPAP